MTRWGMVIDLRKCIGCNACVVTCGEANHLPQGLRRRVEDCGVLSSPPKERILLSIACQQCGAPSCLKVCPTGATARLAGGIIGIDDDRCIGCGYCIMACPYRARALIPEGHELELREGLKEPGTETGEKKADRTGICTKCDFCRERIEIGLSQGLTPGKDPEATPRCVISCSARALHFGDLEDPESNVSRLLREQGFARLQEPRGTDPAVYYLVPDGWLPALEGDKEG